ncbi:Transcriptional regulator, contains XRE-family HTH domain [Kosakonia oryzendophytica]|uniref:Transcriptional regulator, contains XRE-family HTH domain n=1 Tax=Kosakonia oryzendophytica TaxID=1005665 RepID=A0A1C3YT36_9ENTR|nr:helix-turn-helix domain-containing protein [Kosakonia oryzendophytica]AMO48223.1 Cro/CI family transcriptional regulator [Enterobacter sp. FY-07]TDT58989.1 transcriptional regulator with XRE-family HTH domain [Enterobacter sp. AG5470]WBT59875.1 helix-turn-helix domain-containing protein [Kosakonia oryzendophytica]SCB73257.1 Transcriptional regulator, contains XRE-family HTH domain [Kosakonia oryzendophytica]
MSSTDYRQRLAARLAALRLQHNQSLDELSSASGISRASLSRIERGEVSPTAEVLNQLCSVYGMTMSRLLNEVEQVAENLFRADQQTLWLDDEKGFERRLLIPPSNQYKCEMIDGKLRPGAFIEYQKPPVQGLEHYLWLYDGELTITQNAEAWSLKKGDSLRFHLSGSSSFRAHDSLGAHYLLVVCKS